MDGGMEEREYNHFARGEGVPLLQGEGGNLCRVKLDAVASAINQCGKRPGIIGDSSRGAGGGLQSRKLPE